MAWRKFRDGDRNVLDKVIRRHGTERICYLMLSLTGNMAGGYQYKRGDWPRLLPFVRSLLNDYTCSAILDAIQEGTTEKYVRPSRRTTSRVA